MMLTTRGRYAVMALADLAGKHNKEGHPVPLSDIASRQQIPLNYLEQIFCRLKKQGVVESVRGPGGGYFLAAPSQHISVAEAILAVDESLTMTRCQQGTSGCMQEQHRCITHDLWYGLEKRIHQYLSAITLADVAQGKFSQQGTKTFPVYLDYNATVPVKPAVVERMVEVMAKPYNASSVHAVGREGNHLLEEARQQVALAVGAHHARVIFTASGTEANNLAAHGLTMPLLVSAIEHVSMLQAREDCSIIPVTKEGIVDLSALEAMLQAHTAPVLVSVMLANNETGIIQPLKEVVALVHRYNGLVHTDASQAVGKIPVDMADLGVDMMTLSAHKFGGPQGAAALVISRCVTLKAHIKGGGQELGIRAGTHNLAAIAGMGVAASRLPETLEAIQNSKELVQYIEKEIRTYAPHAIILGEKVPRLPNTYAIAMPGVGNETQLIHFDLHGVAVSSGSACSSGKVGVSHVLHAMQVPQDIAGCVVRVSLGEGTTQSDVDRFLSVWKQLYDRSGAKIETMQVCHG